MNADVIHLEEAMKLDRVFRAKLEKSPAKGGWTYVVWPESVSFFGTRGLVKVRLPKGKSVLTVHILTEGNMNLAYFDFREAHP